MADGAPLEHALCMARELSRVFRGRSGEQRDSNGLRGWFVTEEADVVRLGMDRADGGVLSGKGEGNPDITSLR